MHIELINFKENYHINWSYQIYITKKVFIFYLLNHILTNLKEKIDDRKVLK